MLDDPIKYGLLGALAIALLIAAFTDLKSRRIANWLNLAIALGAPLYWFASGMSIWPDMAIQLGLGVAAFLGFSALFAMKWMGGGDVKLLTALALWMTPAVYLKLLIMMALLGGVLTLIFGAWNVMSRRNAKSSEKNPLTIPYGVAIALAGLWSIGSFYIPASAIAGVTG
ncbi:A24 family peptidase [Erythrobacter sp. EC-HK427]|uniref:A24 family peptidase n=1 Tax=Erythrobacter sp. EC-HK427 TaxID=2038396 RepID=UPI001256B719|nr:prepilin peptidase [Erythrobacter sp. EC-HK427]VVS97921.1 Type IV prepilin peptidase, cpaA [Erythrobacter sp. EC-HK427]